MARGRFSERGEAVCDDEGGCCDEQGKHDPAEPVLPAIQSLRCLPPSIGRKCAASSAGEIEIGEGHAGQDAERQGDGRSSSDARVGHRIPECPSGADSAPSRASIRRIGHETTPGMRHPGSAPNPAWIAFCVQRSGPGPARASDGCRRASGKVDPGFRGPPRRGPGVMSPPREAPRPARSPNGNAAVSRAIAVATTGNRRPAG